MRKLGNDISISELQGMVESGMTRKEISKALDISYTTLYRYLGPSRPYKKREPGEQKAKPEPVPQTETKPWPTLAERLQKEVEDGLRKAPEGYVPPQAKKRFQNRTEYHTISIDGEYARYQIDVMQKTVMLTTTLFSEVPLGADELGKVIEEMQAIQQELRAV